MSKIYKLYDTLCLATIEKDLNMTVPWYLMAAYAYYIEDQPIISDYLFDYMAVQMIKNWDSIRHFHKHLIVLDDLEAGTLLLKDYPQRVIGAVNNLRRTQQESSLQQKS